MRVCVCVSEWVTFCDPPSPWHHRRVRLCTGLFFSRVTNWLLCCGLEVRVCGTSPYAPTVLLLVGREEDVIWPLKFQAGRKSLMGRGAFDMTVYKMRDNVLLRTLHASFALFWTQGLSFCDASDRSRNVTFRNKKRPEPKCDFPQ